MVAFNAGTIKMNRADGVRLNITLKNQDGSDYLILPTDTIEFFLLREPNISPNNKPIFTKEFSHPGYPSIKTAEFASANIFSYDTRFLEGDDYYYTIVVTHRKPSGSELKITYSETVLYGRFILEF